MAPLLDSRIGRSKQQYCFEVNDGQLFAFAGLWDGWKDGNGETIETCSILTTTANTVTSVAHDRMPVILERDSYERWLSPQMRDANVAVEMLKPYDAELMRSYPVSTRINYVANDDLECSRPVELVEPQPTLFS